MKVKRPRQKKKKGHSRASLFLDAGWQIKLPVTTKSWLVEVSNNIIVHRITPQIDVVLQTLLLPQHFILFWQQMNGSPRSVDIRRYCSRHRNLASSNWPHDVALSPSGDWLSSIWRINDIQLMQDESRFRSTLSICLQGIMGGLWLEQKCSCWLLPAAPRASLPPTAQLQPRMIKHLIVSALQSCRLHVGPSSIFQLFSFILYLPLSVQ